MDEYPTYHSQKTQHAKGLRQVRWRATSDVALLLLFAATSASLGTTPYQRLLAGTAAISIGIFLFILRRGADLERLARHDRWREKAVEGRGMPLESWRNGDVMEAWEERRKAGI